MTNSAPQPVLARAIAEWTAPVSLEISQRLANVNVVITDVPGAMLGLAQHITIYVDYTAAGHGWFVDPMPALDEAFERFDARESLRAIRASVAEKMDRLTVVLHELGDVLREFDPQPGEFISGELEPGMGPDAAAVDKLLSGYGTGE